MKNFICSQNDKQFTVIRGLFHNGWGSKKKKMDYIVVINVLLLEKIRKAKCYENDNEIWIVSLLWDLEQIIGKREKSWWQTPTQAAT